MLFILLFKKIKKIGALQSKLRAAASSSYDHHDVLKAELSRRDETIQLLRSDILQLQNKRDTIQAQVGNKIFPVLLFRNLFLLI